MVISRINFFLILIAIIIGPFFVTKFFWLIHSQKANGVFAFNGRGNALDQIRMASSQLYFKHGNDTIWFKGPAPLELKEGTLVSVRYNTSNPADARLNTFFGVWGATLIYGGILLLILLAVYLNPQVVPYKAKLRLSIKKPYIQIV